MTPVLPRIGGIVLASGLSRRFGPHNKLLAVIDGETVVRRTVRPYTEAGLQPVLVVVGYEAAAVERALEGLPVRLIDNPEYAEGQSRALVRGIGALPGETAAAVIGVADQPFLTAAHVAAVVAGYQTTGASIVVPRYAGRRGNPVLFDRSLFAELAAVTGDRGGRAVLQRRPEAIAWLDLGGQADLDVDTPEDLESARRAAHQER